MKRRYLNGKGAWQFESSGDLEKLENFEVAASAATSCLAWQLEFQVRDQKYSCIYCRDHTG